MDMDGWMDEKLDSRTGESMDSMSMYVWLYFDMSIVPEARGSQIVFVAINSQLLAGLTD